MDGKTGVWHGLSSFDSSLEAAVASGARWNGEELHVKSQMAPDRPDGCIN